MKLQTTESFSSVHWEGKRYENETKSCLRILMKNVSKYIQNVSCDIYALELDDVVLPVTVIEKRYTDSYVTSPYNQYVTYLQKEVKRYLHPIGQVGVAGVLGGMALLLRSLQNRIVYVDNWLVSTNLHVSLSDEDIKNITKLLSATFPQHAIAFRSVNEIHCQELKRQLERSGYNPLGSRIVYHWDPSLPEISHIRNTRKRDEKMFQKTGYRVLEHKEIKGDDIKRICELYHKLYVGKYSEDNPQYTEEYFRQAHQSGFLRFLALQKDTIDGVIGYFERDGIMTTPLLGWDTDIPQETGLYRMLNCLIMKEASDHNLLLNQSSGAGEFKRSRGGIPLKEYSYVYTNHLPFVQRQVWKWFSEFVNTVGMHIAWKYR